MAMNLLTQVGLAVAIPIATAGVAQLWSLNGNVLVLSGRIEALTDKLKTQEQLASSFDGRLRTLELQRHEN